MKFIDEQLWLASEEISLNKWTNTVNKEELKIDKLEKGSLRSSD